MSYSLSLHSGSRSATLDEIARVETPAATKTWQPVPHVALLDQVKAGLANVGMAVKSEAYGLWGDGARLFGVLELMPSVATSDEPTDYGLVMGVRNSHDQTFPAAGAIGSRVFVCDNLAFSAEVTFARKHTSRIMADLPHVVERAIGRLMDARGAQDRRIAAYKAFAFSGTRDPQVHDVMVRALEARAVPQNLFLPTLKEFRNPRHPEFAEPTAWSLFNAFTETLKASSALELPRRTQALYGIMDTAVGLLAPAKVEQVGDAEIVDNR